MTECQHDKAYTGEVYTSNPPFYGWICRTCFVGGKDWEPNVSEAPVFVVPEEIRKLSDENRKKFPPKSGPTEIEVVELSSCGTIKLGTTFEEGSKDALELLAQLLYNRPARTSDLLRGSDAKILHDSFAIITKLQHDVKRLEDEVENIGYDMLEMQEAWEYAEDD